jgi:hypothetical protein
VTEAKMGRDFDTYFHGFLILEKSENSVELDIFLKINLPMSRLLRSSMGGHEHSTFILGDGVN